MTISEAFVFWCAIAAAIGDLTIAAPQIVSKAVSGILPSVAAAQAQASSARAKASNVLEEVQIGDDAPPNVVPMISIDADVLDIDPNEIRFNPGPSDEDQETAARIAAEAVAGNIGRQATRLAIKTLAAERYKVRQDQDVLVPVPPFGSAANRIPRAQIQFENPYAVAIEGAPKSIDGKNLRYSPNKLKLDRNPKEVELPDVNSE